MNATTPNEVGTEACKIQKLETLFADDLAKLKQSCRVLSNELPRDEPISVHKLLVVGSIDIVGEVDQKLGETALGGCIVSKNRREGSISERLREALAQSLACASVITQAALVSDLAYIKSSVIIPKEAPHNVLEQADGLLLYELVDHITEDSADCIEAFVGLTDVRKPYIVQKDLLYDENGDGLAEF